jgi:DUF1365 family protein
MESNRLNVHIENHKADGEKVFDATLALKQASIEGKEMTMIWLALPFMTLKIVLGIYYQALKLWRKGIKFVPYQTYSTNVANDVDSSRNRDLGLDELPLSSNEQRKFKTE